MTSTRTFLRELVGCTLRVAQMHFNVWQWSAMPPRIDCPADLASDDVYAPDPIYDLAATDTSFEESRQIREAAMKDHAEVSIRDRIEGAVRARPRTLTVLRADDVTTVWKTNPPSKRGRWVGPGVCIGTHRGSVWVNMRGSLWKCSQLQCKLATTAESRGLEVQNQSLDDMKAEFPEFPGRRVYTDVEREGVPPKDVDRPSAAHRAVEEEEDRVSALLPTVPLMTSPLPSIPEMYSERQHSLSGALQSEIAASSVSRSISNPLSTDCTHREVSSLQRTLAAEAEKQLQTLEGEQRLEDQQQNSEGNSLEERVERKTLSNQARDHHHEVVDEHPTQRPRLENPASAIRWSKTDESGHWSPITVPEAEEMWVETDPEVLWQQQVDDHVWENTGKPVCLFQEEWSDLFGNTRDNITAYLNFSQSKDTGLTATKMTRNDELPRHLIPDSERPRFLQATVAEWTAILDTSAVTIMSPAAAKDI